MSGSTTRRVVAAGALVLAGCSIASDGSDGGRDAAAPSHDGAAAAQDITARYALALSLVGQVELPDGGTTQMPFDVLTIWQPYQKEGPLPAAVATEWLPCQLPVAGLPLPFTFLNHGTPQSLGGFDGTSYRDDVAIVYGAKLAKPLTDALPTSATPQCAAPSDTGCVVYDEISAMPGAVLDGRPFGVGLLGVVVRLRFHVENRVDAVTGAVTGAASDATIDARVLSCRRLDGTDCDAATLARIDAAHRTASMLAGPTRGHAQGAYFTCLQLLNDPEPSLTGVEPPDAGQTPLDAATDAPVSLDGGAPLDGAALGDAAVLDGSGDGGDDGGAPHFSREVQSDIDRVGCATAGCHETIDGPGKLHLQFQPATDAARRQNFSAVLPFTTGANGGAFVNQVPLPPSVRSRWLAWIAAGAPY